MDSERFSKTFENATKFIRIAINKKLDAFNILAYSIYRVVMDKCTCYILGLKAIIYLIITLFVAV